MCAVQQRVCDRGISLWPLLQVRFVLNVIALNKFTILLSRSRLSVEIIVFKSSKTVCYTTYGALEKTTENETGRPDY
jgi:hypothetical protein